jgi:hypothetical protein
MTPFALIAPVLGPALDHARRQRAALAVGVTLGRAVLCFLIARHLKSILLYPEAFGMLVLMKSFSVTKSALVPAVVSERAELVRANSRLTLAGVIGGAAAGSVAVGVLKLGGARWVLFCGAIVYLACARLTMLVPRSRAVPVGEPSTAGSVHIHLAGIRLAAVAMAVLRGGVGFLVFLLAFALKRQNEPAWFYGAVVGASSAGGFIGAVVAPRVRKLLREEALLVIALAIPAATALLTARSQGRPAALMVAFTLGLGASAGRAAFDSLVQRDAPDTAWGRAFARYEAYFQLAWVLGAFLPVLRAISTGFGLDLLAFGLVAGGFMYLGGLAAGTLLHAGTNR